MWISLIAYADITNNNRYPFDVYYTNYVEKKRYDDEHEVCGFAAMQMN